MKKKHIGMAFGVFDILHPGHVKYLKAAKRLGDYLIVVITPDANVAQSKGKPAVNSEKDRAFLVGSLAFVDKAVVGFEKDFYKKTLEKFRPDVLALGYDMKENEKELEKKALGLGLKISVKRMPAFEPQKHKSTRIKMKIKETH